MRVLFVCRCWSTGGIERIIDNYIKELSRQKIDFELLCFYRKSGAFDATILNYNIPIYVPKHIRSNNFLEIIDKYNFISEQLKGKHYDIIHYNATRGLDLIFLSAIKKSCPDARIIVHSHATEEEEPHKKIKTFLHFLLRSLYSHYIDLGIGCSEKALNWLFTNSKIKSGNAKVIFAGIQLEKYHYDESSRKQKRQEYEIDEQTFVMGHIGRMCYQKNSEFVIYIFAELKKYRPNSKLLYIGQGELKNKIIELAKDLKVVNDIIFVDQTNDVPMNLNCMDCFVLPSRFEGFGLVLLEAQASGLVCFASSEVPIEAKISDKFYFSSIQDPPQIWAEEIIMKTGNFDSMNRANAWKGLVGSNADAHYCAQHILQEYKAILKGL